MKIEPETPEEDLERYLWRDRRAKVNNEQWLNQPSEPRVKLGWYAAVGIGAAIAITLYALFVWSRASNSFTWS